MAGFTFPLALPNIRGLKAATWRLNKVVGINTAPGSLATQVYEWPGERWEADLTLPLMRGGDAADWLAWMMALRGPVGSFLMAPPGIDQRGAAALAPGTPQVDGNQNALSRQLAVKTTGLGNVARYFRAGDYFNLGSGATTRLHTVLQDAALVSGKVTLDIAPALRAAVADNDPLTVVKPMGKFMMSAATVQTAIDSARRQTPAAFTVFEDLRPVT